MSGQTGGIDPERFADKIRDVGEATPSGETSSAGATGVMQVLPGTAASPGFGVRPASGPGDLDRLGRDYAKALLQKYTGSQLLASAAYNAGPGRVDQWIAEFGDPRSGKISEADWAAKIPYKETQGYVTRMALGGQGAVPPAGRQSNPLAPHAEAAPVPAAAPPAPLPSVVQPPVQVPQTAPDPSRTMALLQLLLPAGHAFRPVDYDPWKIQKLGTGE